MTKKETLKHFKTWCQQTLGNNCSDKDFDMANNIMALLEQEPCEMTVCEDTISRQAVLEYIQGSEAELGHDSENELVCQDIKALPPVQSKPKMGYWIDADGDNAICACCNRLNHLYGEYCKHCGAKMEYKGNW